MIRNTEALIERMEKGENLSGDERKAIEDTIRAINNHISDVLPLLFTDT